jgi:hypothetical protein
MIEGDQPLVQAPVEGVPRFATVDRFEVSTADLFSKSFSTFGDNILLVFLVSVVIELPNFLFFGFVTRYTGVPVLVRLAAQQTVSAVALGLVTAAVTYSVLRRLRGSPVARGEGLAQGLSSCVFALPVVLLNALCLGVSILCLVIPAFLVQPMLAAAVPAAVEERLSPVAALRRSRDLTAGHRIAIFIALLVPGIVSVILMAVVNFILKVLPEGISWVAGAVVRIVALALTSGLQASASVVIYERLRKIKKAPDAALLAVFD